MSELLSIPLKKPAEADVVKPLKNLIQSSYNNLATDKSNGINEAINEFSKQRSTAIWKVFEKYENSLEIIYSYYDQLCALETKVPVQELQIPFKWKDAFDKGTIFGGKMSLTLSSLGYEKVCVLFNIAALQSAVAAGQSIDNDENLKLAAKLFQTSSGIFSHLKSAAPAAIPQEPTPDLTPETLNALSNLMLAQAQEIFVFKAIRDNMKDMIIAKLCCQCEELYSEVLRGLQKDSLRNLWDKDWIPTIAGKQAGFHALTMFYHSLVSRSTKAVGEEIARLQKAVELFKIAQTRSGKPNFLEEFLNKAQRNLVESKKDNDFIYNAMIPDVNSLPTPGKAQLAKMIPLGTTLSSNFKDLFTELVPVVLHQAMSSCEARKSEIVNTEVMKLRESTQVLNSVLSSMNLPAAIEVTASGSALPPSLLEKAETVREKGGLTSLRKLIDELPELLKRNREILDEAERIMIEEKESDDQLRKQFNERWKRTPSEKLTDMFRSNTDKYRKIINDAVQADKTVREKFEINVDGMELLSKSPEEIKMAIPSAGGSASSSSNSSAAQKLRVLMESVETIKAERDVIESELKSATVNLKDQFLQALAADGAINEPAISIAQIGKSLGPLSSQVQESLSRQEVLVQEIKAAHQEFSSEMGSNTNTKDTLFSELATAYDVFTELQHNLQEGTKFYNDLTHLLVVFQNKISDFAYARKTEKEELLKDLTQESSRQTAGTTPNIPSHHSSTSSGGDVPKQPPVRPPPPSASTPNAGSAPYPVQMQGMPQPYGASSAVPYPAYMPPPMPQGFNPYATLPYPTNPYYQFPQGPPGHYGTYPGAYAHQAQQQQQPPNSGYPQQQNPGYPQQNQQQPFGW